MPAARTACTASMTRPGPIGRPATRSARAKCMRFAVKAPVPSSEAVVTSAAIVSPLGCELLLDFAQDARCLGTTDLGDIVLIFEQGAERIVDRRRIERHAVELDQRLRPVDRLSHAW